MDRLLYTIRCHNCVSCPKSNGFCLHSSLHMYFLYLLSFFARLIPQTHTVHTHSFTFTHTNCELLESFSLHPLPCVIDPQTRVWGPQITKAHQFCVAKYVDITYPTPDSIRARIYLRKAIVLQHKRTNPSSRKIYFISFFILLPNHPIQPVIIPSLLARRRRFCGQVK